jgi:uncharacterized protein (DUF1778 family)
MADTHTVKQERMHIRLDTISKPKPERAAACAYKTLTEFALGQALHAADEVIQQHETIMLDEADWGVFLDALDSPPEPHAKLRQAFAEQEKRVRR